MGRRPVPGNSGTHPASNFFDTTDDQALEPLEEGTGVILVLVTLQ